MHTEGGRSMDTTTSSSLSSNNKRQRNDDDYAENEISQRRRKQHLYLALDDWKGGFSIHKLDGDDMIRRRPDQLLKLPEPAVLRLAAPVPGGTMAFAALGTNIMVATNPCCTPGPGPDHAPPTLVYDTETGALSSGPRIPDRLRDFGTDAMAVGESLYALTSSVVSAPAGECPSFHVLSWAPTTVTATGTGTWDPTMEWSWSIAPLPPPSTTLPFYGSDIITYAVHPDGHTLFVSTSCDTHCFDTTSNVWRQLGDWVLPFRGQAYFDALDAWVGIHRNDDGHLCCCPVPSRSTATTRPPGECRMLTEKLFRKEQGVPEHLHLRTTLSYMGDSRLCLVESFKPRDVVPEAVLHVTMFGLKYDHKGVLRIQLRRRVTRSFSVSKNALFFSHAAFWM